MPNERPEKIDTLSLDPDHFPKPRGLDIARLNPEMEYLDASLEKSFEYDLTGKKAGGFDSFTWNLYQLLIRFNLKQGVKGARSWGQASREAAKIAGDLREIEIEAPVEGQRFEDLGPRIIIKKLVKNRQIFRMALHNNLDLEIYGKKGELLYKLNLIAVRRDKSIELSQNKRGKLLLEDLEKLVTTAGVKAGKVRDGFYEFLGVKKFEELKIPKIAEFRPEQSISGVGGMRSGREAPKIITPELRNLDLCSSYVIEILEQAYGREAVRAAGMVRFSKYADAWEIKTRGIKSGKLESAASTMNALVLKKHGLEIKDKKLYAQKLGDLFRAADRGPYPTILTAFQTNTEYFNRIAAANKNRPDEEKNYNSHILVVLGRENERSLQVDKKCRLGKFLKKELKIAENLLCHLKLRILKADGSSLNINDDGKTATRTKTDGSQETVQIKLADYKLAKGDRVFWQDVLVSDFYKGQERVLGMAELASVKEVILMENLRFTSGILPKSSPDYQPVGFIQLEAGKYPAEQFKTRLGYSDEDLSYYLAALADLGINLNYLQPKELLPVFDLQKLRETVDKKGGPSSMSRAIVADNVRTYNEKHPESKLIIIESGKTPWALVKDFFEPNFNGKHALTGRERAMILDAVDQSCGDIDLKLQPPKFEAGARILLTNRRIAEIINYIFEKQSEKFGDEDYVKIIESGDDPLKFLAECYGKEASESIKPGSGMPKNYAGLDKLEREFLLKALRANNRNSPNIDLGLETRVYKTVWRNFPIVEYKRVWKNFPIGSRIVLGFKDLKFCMEEIASKRSLQAPNEYFEGPMTDPLRDDNNMTVAMGSKIMMGPQQLKLPLNIRDNINRVFPGKTLEETIVRNSLYFIYAKEKLGGGYRAFKKDMARELGRENRSLGTFQIRPTQQDMINCRDKFDEMGVEMPADFDSFVNLIVDNPLAATIVAGERMRESYRSFRHFMNMNGEKDTAFMDREFAVMLVTSYNRSTASIYRAVFQNWAYNLAEKAGVDSDVSLDDIDAKSRPGLIEAVIGTFKSVAEKLQKDGKIKFNGNVDDELAKISGNCFSFLQSPLFQEIQKWYRSENGGTGLKFIFENNEMERGDHIFSYGRRYLPEGPHSWQMAFTDHAELKSVVEFMSGDYQLPDNGSREPREKMAVPVPAEPKEDVHRGDLLVESGIRDCCESGTNILTVLVSRVALRAAPNGQRIDNLYFGNKLEVQVIKNVGGEWWAGVRVVEGPDLGKRGFIGFDREFYSNEHGPQLDPILQKKLETAAKNPDRPLPADYKVKMENYLRFINNLNPKETAHSAALMAKSRPTAVEILDQSVKDKIFKIAAMFGYRNEKFFGMVLKNGVAGLTGQRLFVIDKDKGRILSFTVSTGRSGHETPSGKYLAVSNGFRDVNYFGSHQGSFAKKYKHVAKMTSLEGGRGSGPLSMTTALIDTRSYKNQESTGIYFHGTNHEHRLGNKASHGCIRMSNLDVVYLASVLNGSNMNFQIIDRVNESKFRDTLIAKVDKGRRDDMIGGKIAEAGQL